MVDYTPMRTELLEVYGEDLEVEIAAVRKPLRAIFLEPFVDMLGGATQRPHPAILADQAAWTGTGGNTSHLVWRGAKRFVVVVVPPTDASGFVEVQLRYEP